MLCCFSDFGSIFEKKNDISLFFLLKMKNFFAITEKLPRNIKYHYVIFNDIRYFRISYKGTDGRDLIRKTPVDAFAYSRYTIRYPRGCRFAFQKMIEEFQLAPLDVFSVLSLNQVMRLSIIIQ